MPNSTHTHMAARREERSKSREERRKTWCIRNEAGSPLTRSLKCINIPTLFHIYFSEQSFSGSFFFKKNKIKDSLDISFFYGDLCFILIAFVYSLPHVLLFLFHPDRWKWKTRECSIQSDNNWFERDWCSILLLFIEDRIRFDYNSAFSISFSPISTCIEISSVRFIIWNKTITPKILHLSPFSFQEADDGGGLYTATELLITGVYTHHHRSAQYTYLISNVASSIIRQTDGITGRRLLSSFLYYFPTKATPGFSWFREGMNPSQKKRRSIGEMIEVHPSS